MTFTHAEWENASPFATFLAGVQKHAELWHRYAETAEVDPVNAARLADLPGKRRVLVLAEDWCGDAVRSVPTIVKALEAAPQVEVRVLNSDDHPGTLGRYLSRGGRSIPIVVVADESGTELGWWGPRPAPLQALLRARLAELGKPGSNDKGAFYAPIMGWYRKDNGQTTLDEVTLLLERGAMVVGSSAASSVVEELVTPTEG